jgi:hypothetical protein
MRGRAGLLRARGERPSGSRTNNSFEIAPSHCLPKARPAKWGSEVGLRGSNPKSLMSALGH